MFFWAAETKREGFPVRETLSFYYGSCQTSYFIHDRYLIHTCSQIRATESMASLKIILL